MIDRDNLRRHTQRTGRIFSYGWGVFTPILVGVSGLLFAGQSEGTLIGGIMIAWAVDLSYQRGAAAEHARIGAMMFEMITGDRSVDITVTHEHRVVATPDLGTTP